MKKIILLFALVVLIHDAERYENFEIRNIAANGEIWTGVADNTRHHFPPLDQIPDDQKPSENMSSIAIRMSYGAFDYFTGGDSYRVIILDDSAESYKVTAVHGPYLSK